MGALKYSCTKISINFFQNAIFVSSYCSCDVIVLQSDSKFLVSLKWNINKLQ
jgi:hypothetical protein